jgi:hypothetical protein
VMRWADRAAQGGGRFLQGQDIGRVNDGLSIDALSIDAPS